MLKICWMTIRWRRLRRPYIMSWMMQLKMERKRRKSSGELPKVEKKPKTPTCHMCPNPPNQASIYCSEHCISLHAGEALKQLGSKASGRNPVVVLEPKTNTLLNGPNAPTQATLPSWLLAHPTFHAVLSRQSSSSSFYNKEKKREEGERKRRDSGEKLKSPVKIKKQPSFLESLQNRPIKSKEELVAETKAKLQRAMSRDGGRPTPAKKEVRRQSSNTTPAPVRRKTVPVKEPSPPSTKSSSDNRTMRKKIAHGIRDALKEKHDKCTGINLPPEKIEKIANEIEIAMFGTFGDVGSKYMNKYRSLSYNIKDSKNDGLFRRILLKDVSPIEVVGMTADEYASKELQQWREQEAKKDIEAIKTHELDMIALGNTFVMKTHKGEQVIENPDGTVPAPPSDPVVLPEEQKVEGEAREKGLSKETWKHPNHGDDESSTLAQCDVCSGKITLQDFVNIKVDKERGRGKRSRSRSRQRDKHHKSHKSSHKSSKDKDSRHSSSKDHKDRDRHPSSKDKERHSSSKDNKEKHSSSRDRHSSSKDKHSTSSKDKEKHRGSKDKPSLKETGSSKEKLEEKSSSSSSKDKSSSASSKDRERHRSGRKSSDKEKTEIEKKSSEKEEEAARMLAEKAELQEKINRAQAAIEAAKRSSGMVMPEDLDREEKNDVEEESFEEPAMDLELPNMDILDEEESAPTLHRRQSGGADEVTSTVTIPTPEQTQQEEAGDTPSVWEGTVIMPDVTKFKVRSYQVSGTSDYLRNDLNSSMSLVGRIPPKTTWDYIEKISKNPQKEILVLRFGPQNNDEVAAYESFFEYLSTKDRLGVVGNASKMVKDCYIMPLGKDQEVPAALLPLEGQGLPPNRPNLLLSILVRTRRHRPGDPIPMMPDPIIKMPNLPKMPTTPLPPPPPSSTAV